jgi:hypothetical protein
MTKMNPVVGGKSRGGKNKCKENRKMSRIRIVSCKELLNFILRAAGNCSTVLNGKVTWTENIRSCFVTHRRLSGTPHNIPHFI